MGNSAPSSLDQWERVAMKSVLIASTCVSLLVNFPIPAWYAVSSFVQPPVNAAGKKARMTFFLPRKSESLISLPLVFMRAAMVKSGAVSPSFKLVFCGAFCANSGRLSAASARRANLLIFSSRQQSYTETSTDGTGAQVNPGDTPCPKQVHPGTRWCATIGFNG